jgi:phosphohistidine phosphatase
MATATGIELYLVRHAIAAERGPDWPDDTRRPLTERGIRRFTAAVDGLRAAGVRIDEICTSPLVRARQTAEILSRRLAGKPAVKTLDALAPGHEPELVLAELARITRATSVALVGHEPGLGQLAAHLIGSQAPLAFRKGGVSRIDLPQIGTPALGSLQWFMPPRVLRQLAGRS